MNKKIMRFLMVGTILILSPFAIAQNYDSELMEYGIQFSPPAGWTKVKSQEANTAIYFKHPHNKAAITISYPKQVNQLSFQGSLALLRMNTKPKEKKTEFLGETCYVFDIEQTTNKGIETLTRDYQFMKNNIRYSIDYTSSVADFNNYLSDFENALLTFRIIAPNQ
ncbi:MAG: hypothetical protein ABIH18_00775 [Candidatus Omnitrophota bacterium]